MGRKGPRAKTKIVLKSVKQWEQLGNMHNLKFQTFLNKNHPNTEFLRSLIYLSFVWREVRHWAHSTNMAPAAGQSCYSSHVTDFSQLSKLLEEASSFFGSGQFAESNYFQDSLLAPNSARFSCQAQGNPRTFGSVTPHLQLLSFKFSCI